MYNEWKNCIFAGNLLHQMKEDSKISLTDETREIIEAYLEKIHKKIEKRESAKDKSDYVYSPLSSIKFNVPDTDI